MVSRAYSLLDYLENYRIAKVDVPLYFQELNKHE
jgi:hypothetical protein